MDKLINLCHGFSIALFLVHRLAVAGFVCEELIVEVDAVWTHPQLPEAAKSQARANRFCNSNPNGFGNTSASLNPHRVPMQCYYAVSGELVLELPNQLFSRCRSDVELDSVLDMHAFNVARLEKKPFTLIVYNEKHLFYRKGHYQIDHRIFERVLDWEYDRERTQYLTEKRKSGEYSLETITCGFLETTLNNEVCPSDLLERYPLIRPK